MKFTGKFESAVLALLHPNSDEWSIAQLDLASMASTVDSLTDEIFRYGRRITKYTTDIENAVAENASYITPLHGSFVQEYSEKLAKFNAFRESLYIMVGMVMGPEAKQQFLDRINDR
jgi:hypothetical protein